MESNDHPHPKVTWHIKKKDKKEIKIGHSITYSNLWSQTIMIISLARYNLEQQTETTHK